MFLVRDYVPSKLLPNENPIGNTEDIFLEISLRLKRWLISGSLFKIILSI